MKEVQTRCKGGASNSTLLASNSLLLSHSFFVGTTVAYLVKIFVSRLPLVSLKSMEAVPPGNQFIQWFSSFLAKVMLLPVAIPSSSAVVLLSW